MARSIYLLLFLLTAHLATPVATAATPDAQTIVQRADRIRFPAGGYQVDVRVTTERKGSKPEVRIYRILSKGNDRSLVTTLYPATDRGQILLMRDQDLWVFLPRVSQPIRLPLSQRLTGQVANGDLARANFAGDYDARLEGREDIEGRHYHVLELKAARRGVTYHRVRYWVEEKTYRPFKAEFYSRSGKLLKVCHYQGYRRLGDTERPTRLVMEDRLRGQERSVMDYSKLKPRKLPDKIFTKSYLKKLRR
ncbi:MAG TPA: outer membrane lipoprotein-sorting protein [Thiotrichales bacterium]|nr:outer membrane lipoprotein-sorting protein [Thiotrichales bacterium]